MAMYCHRPGCEDNEFDDAQFMCRTHRVDLVPDPPPVRNRPATSPRHDNRTGGPPNPTPASCSGRAWSVDTCWNCGAVSPNPDNTRCLECPETLVPPRLLLTWETGKVRLDPGETVVLGREGPYAKLFQDFDNVSRTHARIGVEANGEAWIQPSTTPNGTFRPGDPDEELQPDRQHALRDGAPVRFARNRTATVMVFALPDS